jgi:DNA polymerase-3 subunit delta
MAPRFYFLHGPDEFGSAEFVADIKTGLGDPAMADLNTTVFDGRSALLAEVRSIADTLPFLAARRLVIVEGWLTRLLGRAEAADKMSADKQSDAEAPAGEPLDDEARRANTAREEMAALADYLPGLPETTALILVEHREIPARNVVLKAAAGADWALVKFFDLPKGEALVRWIRARARAEGGEITLEAARSLAEVEGDPRALGHEIAKLLAYANYARPVELADVHTLTPAGGEAIIWDMVDAIGQRRGPVAQRELHKLLQTAQPQYVLSMIVRQYRLLLQVRELLDERRSETEISKALGMKPYPTGKFCAQARGFSLAGLEHIYRRLLEYDVDIKTGRIEIEAALDTLVGALTTG